MSAQTTLVPTAEAAYLAGLTERQMNRIVDEHLVPAVLFRKDGSTRRFTRLSAAFAHFYFDTEQLLTASARRQILEELIVRVEKLIAKNDVYALQFSPALMNWKVSRQAVDVDIYPYIVLAQARAKEVGNADALVTKDPEIMGGAAVFAGTRVLIEVVLGSISANEGMGRLVESYPFLTEAHLEAAKVYSQVHPRRGLPRRIEDAHPGLSLRSIRVIRPARA